MVHCSGSPSKRIQARALACGGRLWGCAPTPPQPIILYILVLIAGKAKALRLLPYCIKTAQLHISRVTGWGGFWPFSLSALLIGAFASKIQNASLDGGVPVAPERCPYCGWNRALRWWAKRWSSWHGQQVFP